MTASYPSAVKSFTTKVDFTDTVLAEHVNSLQEETVSLQENLGTSIKTGSGWVGVFDLATTNWNTLKDRLANMEYGIKEIYDRYVSDVGGSTIIPSGSSIVGLNIKAASGQTANLLEARNSSNTVVFSVDSSGIPKYSSNTLATVTGTETFQNKTISGSNNTLSDIPPTAVIVTGTTDIKEYTDARPTVVYSATQPDAVTLGYPAGTIWVDSSSDVDETQVSVSGGSLNDTLMLMGG